MVLYRIKDGRTRNHLTSTQGLIFRQPNYIKMKHVCVYLLCLVLLPMCIAGQSNLDSLKHLIQHGHRDTLYVRHCFSVAKKYQFVSLDSSLVYIEKAWQASNELQFYPGIANALFLKIGTMRIKGQNQEAFQLNKKWIHLADDPRTGAEGIKLLNSMTHFFMEDLQSDSSLYYLQRAEKLNIERGYAYNNYIVYADIGNNYGNQQNDVLQESYLKKAYEITKTKMIRKDHGMILYLLMEYYFPKGRMKEYAPLANEYLELLQKGDGNMKMDQVHNVLYFFDEEETVNDKITKLESALTEQLNRGFLNNATISADMLVQLKQESGDIEGAIVTANRGLLLAKEQDKLYEQAGFLNQLGRLHELKKDYANAIHFYKDGFEMDDSLKTVAVQNNLMELEVKYQTEKKEADLKIANLQLLKKNTQNRMLVFGLIGLGLLTLVTARFLYFKTATNRLLQNKNATIQKALLENETLLREIHHRVKNNLQVVSSLLKLQSRSITDKDSKAIFKEGQDRVQSMALIHQNLYQTDNLAGMNVQEYISKLCQNLMLSYQVDQEQIQLNTDIDSIVLDVETLIPLGLILNEVISNALKYAFEGIENGAISISLKKEPEILLLEISDNGIGISENALKNNSHSFGMTLINDFARKLEAKVEMVNSSGTTIKLEIRKYKMSA